MKKVFFYGDSNTYGYDPAGFFGGRYPRQYRWTAILKDRLAGEWEVAADGMPGRAIPPKGRAMEYLRGSMRSEMPVDLFAVMLGTNDILGTPRPDAARTAEDMEDLVVLIANAGIPQILLIAPPKISFTPQSFQMSYVYGDSSYAPLYCEQGEKLTEYYRKLGLVDLPIQLILSGHAHGGQWRIGRRGVYAPGQGLLPFKIRGNAQI